ncbi:MAG: hypothetical protein ABFE01_29220, partial [Phycisphaerales bacterium]
MNVDYWAGIVTLLVGWSLKEVGDRLRLRREERKPFAKAIADLLELRHRLWGITAVIGEIKKRSSIPPEAEVALRTAFDAVFPQQDDLQRRYNEAVNLVAAVDPILGFRLRSKDEFFALMQKIRPLLVAEDSIRPLIVQIEDTLSGGFLEALKDVTIELAWAHSMVTWWRIRRRFSKAESIPKELTDLFR